MKNSTPSRSRVAREIQRMFFDVPPPARKPAHYHTSTSRAAADKAVAKLSKRSEQILSFVRERGPIGCTRDEIANGLCLPIQSVCSPCKQLIDAGDLVETDRTRPTRYGCAAAVLIARGTAS